jgi:hypothetical protein
MTRPDAGSVGRFEHFSVSRETTMRRMKRWGTAGCALVAAALLGGPRWLPG